MIKNVPDGWRVEKISEIFTLKQGKHLAVNDLHDEGYDVYGANGIIGKYDQYMYEDSKVLITCRGATCGNINISKPKSWITGNAIALISKKDYINDIYVAYFLKKDKLANVITGSAQPQIVVGSLSKKKIPIPPLSQQEKIVKVLDISSELIEKQKELIENYDLFLKSKFIEMFGDPIKNPMGWEVVKFEDVLFLQRGYDLPINNRHRDGKIKVFGSNGVMDYHNEAKIIGGGVITGRSGTLGKIHYTFEDYWPLNTTLFSKDLRGNNIIFLAYFLEMFKVERFTQGAGVPTLNRNLVHKEKTYKIPIELQNKFASIVEKIETIKTKETQKLEHLETLHNSLMDKAFKGEIE